MNAEHKPLAPDRIASYFRMEWLALLITTISGLL